MKKNNGITLIALVITIIVLLILAGVTINLVLQENGIFGIAQQAAKDSKEAEIKEEIALAILDIQTEELSKGNVLTLDILYEKLSDKLIGISLQKEEGYLKGEYKGYSFNINSDFQVEMDKKIKGITVSFTLKNSNGNVLGENDYTNGNITLVVNASSTEGNITEITTTSELTSTGNGVYTIIANGNYEFTAIDETGLSKTITVPVQKIDKLAPQVGTPIITDVTGTGFKILPNEADADGEADGTNVKSGIARYEYYINGTKSESTDGVITGLTKSTSYTVSVKAIDRAGNTSAMSTAATQKTSLGTYATLTLNGFVGETEGIYSLNGNATDGRLDTYEDIFGENTSDGISSATRIFYVDERCCGKYVSVYIGPIDSSTYWVYCWRVVFYSDEARSEQISGDRFDTITSVKENIKAVRSVQIPENTKLIELRPTTANDACRMYEVWCSDTDLSGTVYPED